MNEEESRVGVGGGEKEEGEEWEERGERRGWEEGRRGEKKGEREQWWKNGHM